VKFLIFSSNFGTVEGRRREIRGREERREEIDPLSNIFLRSLLERRAERGF